MSSKDESKQLVWIERTILNFIDRSDENTLRNQTDDKAFVDPLVGFSNGGDLLYEAYKDHVGPFHWTPKEIFNLTFPDLDIDPEELTVISWILPKTEAARADNRRENEFPSERWIRARMFGEAFNVKLRKLVVDVLQEKGYKAVSPMLSPEWSRKMSEKYGFASTWSERL